MLRRRLLFSLLILAAFGSGAFFAARYSTGGSSTEAQPGAPVAAAHEVLEQDRQQPRFVGELLGVFIDPSLDAPLPPGYKTFAGVSDNLPTVDVPLERAGTLGLTLTSPPDYVLQSDSMNTGVIACGQTVYAARWDYTHKASNGMTANIVIDRVIFKQAQSDVAASRVKAVQIGGREAVLIEPVTPDAVMQRSGVIFPEPFGVTFIDAANLPLKMSSSRPFFSPVSPRSTLSILAVQSSR